MDLEQEIEFHRHVAEVTSPVEPTPPDKFEEYRLAPQYRTKPLHRFLAHIHNSNPRTILELGAGAGQLTTRLAHSGYEVTALELSPEQASVARARSQLDGVEDRVTVIEADIEEWEPAQQKFDLIVAKLVLHHVDLDRALDLMIKALNPDGVAVIWEPVAFCPSLQRIRDLTPVPKDISPNERQLDARDLDLISLRFGKCEVDHFYLLGRLKRILPPTARVVTALEKIDSFLLRVLPWLRHFAGTVVIRCEAPISDRTGKSESKDLAPQRHS